MSADNIIQFLRWYAGERLNSRLIDEHRRPPASLPADLASGGLLGLRVGVDHGGQGLSARDTARVLEQLGAIDGNVSLLTTVHNAVGIDPILAFADQDTKDKVLPVLASTGALAGVAATEPEVGTNFQAMTSRAVRDGSGYVINGTKSMISLGAWAKYINLTVRLDDSLTTFLVPTGTPGWVPVSEALTVGMRAVPQNHIEMRNMRLDADAVLGGVGNGAAVATHAFQAGRWMLAAGIVGTMKRCLQLATRYVSRRTVATGPLLSNGRIEQILSDCVASVEAVDAVTRLIYDGLDEGRVVDPTYYTVCKIVSGELSWSVIDTCVQLMGWRGFLDSNPVTQNFRDYRVLRVFEGSTDGISGYLGRSVLKNPGKLHTLLTEDFPAADFLAPLWSALDEASASFPSLSPQRQHRLAAGTANAVAWAVTAAALRNEGGEVRAHTFEWAARSFSDAVHAMRRSHHENASVVASAKLSEHIGSYEDQIGDIEQTYGGEIHTLDPLLQRAL
ncbi:acyl-CoA dehydrogenase family protein [Burkholderia dolosa]|uniref:Acyl-CoA dehydrogenase family protein n=1 Tax=Burkholderia dolosa TaxID=152500 RepID=A0A892ID27_9BURK|nr:MULTISPECIES: acyl-CoA dehydrogenase family protein [Burkholderia]AJY11218.1 hypothetical protein AK34_5544 [Burkholderia dolosa AU0158]ETP61434.1 hypothetical protein BDSB_27205 [Burkholderia dolosa PC543]MBR8418794.1 acyl-CoA dehydrogenase family protein [Burkholderia dolosa]MBY4657809.1 acyl-CoA dehydrogenase family protein [Burkholderia dolosa]MBY4780662.1 acyl-CoA dehydrogenase family protein [Burkholderia dolosa]